MTVDNREPVFEDAVGGLKVWTPGQVWNAVGQFVYSKDDYGRFFQLADLTIVCYQDHFSFGCQRGFASTHQGQRLHVKKN